ncbi:hypothetical protein E2C01_009485 [Portunus trituberculatus]|uniref:Uncharacterized protein n=1 Tax=Portunus trituberculatus TaxID=210409 RepID=A0A5B7D5X2_PORTR|nr:hypothetical protein [Portunus trituberculatus]
MSPHTHYPCSPPACLLSTTTTTITTTTTTTTITNNNIRPHYDHSLHQFLLHFTHHCIHPISSTTTTTTETLANACVVLQGNTNCLPPPTPPPLASVSAAARNEAQVLYGTCHPYHPLNVLTVPPSHPLSSAMSPHPCLQSMVL